MESKLTFERLSQLTDEDIDAIGKMITDADKTRHASDTTRVTFRVLMHELPLEKHYRTLYDNVGKLQRMGIVYHHSAGGKSGKGKHNSHRFSGESLATVVRNTRSYIAKQDAEIAARKPAITTKPFRLEKIEESRQTLQDLSTVATNRHREKMDVLTKILEAVERMEQRMKQERPAFKELNKLDERHILNCSGALVSEPVRADVLTE